MHVGATATEAGQSSMFLSGGVFGKGARGPEIGGVPLLHPPPSPLPDRGLPFTFKTMHYTERGVNTKGNKLLAQTLLH